MDGRKVSVLPFSVVVDERWNGKCSRNEMVLYPLPVERWERHVPGEPLSNNERMNDL